MSIKQIVYVSEGVVEFDRLRLVAMLEKARENNRRTGITGVLLHSAGRFAQCIEGEKEAIDTLYLRISGDVRHRDVVKLQEVMIPARCFAQWSMGCVDLLESEYLRLSTAQWQGSLAGHANAGWVSPGFVLMESLWNAYLDARL